MGEMPSKKALEIAIQRDLNLYVVDSSGPVPVCKLRKNEKYLYGLKKQKPPKVQKLSCIRFGIGTDTNDFNVKIKKILSLLAEGEKVSVVLRCKGRREALHVSTVGLEVVNKVVVALEGKAILDQKPQVDGRSVRALFMPLTKKR